MTSSAAACSAHAASDPVKSCLAVRRTAADIDFPLPAVSFAVHQQLAYPYPVISHAEPVLVVCCPRAPALVSYVTWLMRPWSVVVPVE